MEVDNTDFEVVTVDNAVDISATTVAAAIADNDPTALVTAITAAVVAEVANSNGDNSNGDNNTSNSGNSNNNSSGNKTSNNIPVLVSAADDKRERQTVNMTTRQDVVNVMYYSTDRKDVAIWQFINKLGNLTTIDFFTTVRILTGVTTIPSDHIECMKLLWAHQTVWQDWLGCYPTYESAKDDFKFRTFVDAIVRANIRVAKAFGN